jgi:hypothetical protein
MKQCGDCEALKPLDAFHANRRRDDGRQTICAECMSIRNKAWRRANPERQKALARRRWVKRLARQFEMTPSQINDALGAGCAICGSMTRRLCIDHDHETGEFRGALCHRCNSAIGFLDDDPALLRKATTYLDSVR